MANNQPRYQAGYRPPQPVPPRRADMPSVSAMPSKGKGRRSAARGPQARPKRKARRGSGAAVAVISLLLMAAVGLAGYSALLYLDIQGQGGDTFYQGVYVGSVHLGGMTLEQAQAHLASMEQQQLNDWYVALQLPVGERRIVAADVDLRLDLTSQLQAAWQVGRQGSLMERQRVINQLKAQPYHATGGLAYDTEKLRTLLAQIQADVARDPVDATADFTPDNEEPFAYVDEVYGCYLDVAPVQREVERYLYSLESGAFAPALQQIPPAVTRAQLQENLTCIVVVNTEINYRSEPGRNENIRIALEKLNGLRVQPDEKVSFNKTVGKRTTGNG
ncbi:MAG: peptidoglycan binding domain-containing protein, partial [Oscillospiraceae bacterium]|nr:peptidoglycan binding domain-containing protein [Oscillospiraceae bacterium]